MVFVSLNSNNTGITSEAGTVHSSEAPVFSLGCQWDLCCSIISILYFFLPFLVIVFYVIFRYAASVYHLVIFKLSLKVLTILFFKRIRKNESIRPCSNSRTGLRSISKQLVQLLGKLAMTLLNDQLRSSANKYGANHTE